MKFFQIVISVVIGMAAGCIPIVGFNIGANLQGRVKELFTKLLVAEAGVGIVSLVIAEAFPNALIQIFGAANESVYYTDFAVKAFRTYLCIIVLACINKAAFIFCRQWAKRWNPLCFLWLGKSYSAWALRFCFPYFSVWTAFFIQCPYPML